MGMMLFGTMFKLMVALLLGFFLFRKGKFSEAVNRALSFLVVQVACPAMIIASSFAKGSESGEEDMVLWLVAAGAVLYLGLLPLTAWLFSKLLLVEKKKSGAYRFLLMFGNIIFMGFPILESLYGEQAVFYCSILHILFNAAIFSYGIFLLKREKGKAGSVRWKDMVSAGSLASVFAIAFHFSGWQPPDFVLDTLKFVGGLTTPLSMIILGSILATFPLGILFKEKRLFFFAAVKLVVYPVLGFFIGRLFFSDPMILGMIVLTLGMPSASMCAMISSQEQREVQTITAGVIITTILSLVTIPAIYFLLLR